MSENNQQQPKTDIISKLSSNNEPKVGLFTLVSATGIGVFMGALDASVVNVSIYDMQQFFSVSLGIIEWVILVYLLIVASLTAIAGKLGDKISNKKVFQVGMIIFTIGSLLSAISPNIEFLIFGRVIQAIGATGVQANGIAIVTRFTTTKNRGKAIGLNSIFVASALTIGPIVGGILTANFGWQSIFLINIPIGALGYFWVEYAIPATPPKDQDKEIDYYGAGIFGLSLIFVIYGITVFDITSSINALLSLIFIAVGIYLFIYFYNSSKHKSSPILDIHLFQNRTFVIGTISAILAFCIMNMVLYQLPLLVQNVYNFSADQAGIVLIGIPFAMAVVGPYAGSLSDKYDPKYITTIAMVGLGLTLIAFIVTTGYEFHWFLTVPLTFMLGATIALFSSPNGNSIMSSVPKNRLGVAGGFIGIARNFGFSLGISISTVLMTIFQPTYENIIGLGSIYSYIPSYQSMLLFGIVFAFIGILITFRRPLMERE